MTSKHTIQYPRIPRIEEFFEFNAAHVVSKTELPIESEINTYNLRDFREVYRYLQQRASMHQAYCWQPRRLAPFEDCRGSMGLYLSGAELQNDLVKSGRMSEHKLDLILQDLTYDTKWNEERADIFLQPLASLPNDSFVVAPSVVTYNAWERNLQKLWALRYPESFSRQVGRVKSGLSATIADAFARHGFLTAVNRPLRLGQRTHTDVDVAVFDSSEDTLLLAEVKWLTAPAETREFRRADRELERGIEQARESAEFVRKHPIEAARLIFPQAGIQLETNTQLFTALIARNHLGSASVLVPDVPILDDEFTTRYLSAKVSHGKALSSIYVGLASLLAQPKRNIHYEKRPIKVRLAGYTFLSEAFSIKPPDTSAPQRDHASSRPGRNDTCPCGSGRKFKKCHGG